jgi:hypothetical protein
MENACGQRRWRPKQTDYVRSVPMVETVARDAIARAAKAEGEVAALRAEHAADAASKLRRSRKAE